MHHNLENAAFNPLKYAMGSPTLNASICIRKSTRIQSVKMVINHCLSPKKDARSDFEMMRFKLKCLKYINKLTVYFTLSSEINAYRKEIKMVFSQSETI